MNESGDEMPDESHYMKQNRMRIKTFKTFFLKISMHITDTRFSSSKTLVRLYCIVHVLPTQNKTYLILSYLILLPVIII